MEVVLLWLDELDDLLFAGLLIREHLARLSLGVGLVAVLVLGASPWSLSFASTLALINVSLASIVVWSLVSWIGMELDRRAARMSGAA